jgi:probable HAF family extracellular repeat protein
MKTTHTHKNIFMKKHIHTKNAHRLLTMTVAACLAIGASTAGAQTYLVSDLGVLPNQEHSEPSAINRNGQVAGTSGSLAFRYTSTSKEKMEDIAKYTKGTSRAFGIADSGLVVGDSTFGTEYSHAAVFSNGSALDLGILKGRGPYSRANDINIAGQVVGFTSLSPDSNDGRAFLTTAKDRTAMVDLGTLGGAYSQAWAINDSGTVTGNSQVKGDTGPTHAFIWTKGGMRDLGTLGGEYSYGTAINENSHVVGYSTIDPQGNAIHAFLYDGVVMNDLGTLASSLGDLDYSYALGLNAYDQVVGYTYKPEKGPWSVAFVSQKGQMRDLNDLIGDAAKEYRIDRATAINDAGQIVAVAFVNSVGAFHAVLLSPNPAGLTPIATESAEASTVTTK